MTSFITPTLDRLENTLPSIPRRLFQLQRSTVGAGFELARTSCEFVTSAIRPVERQASTSAAIATGQARSAAQRVASTARSGLAEVIGQASAQTERTVAAMEEAADKTIDRANDLAESIETSALEQLTKDELYDRAKEADVVGRSSMSKEELVQALSEAS